MSREDFKRYYEILELSPDAPLSEIKNAYLRLKKLYSTDSIVISPIVHEFSKKKRREVLKQIEEAYKKLMVLLEDEQSQLIQNEKPFPSSDVPEEENIDSTIFGGHELKQIREKRGIKLYEIALDTKIRMELLKNIEFENFDALPSETYLKGHLMNYASFLLLNPKKVADDYIKKYKEWKNKSKKKA